MTDRMLRWIELGILVVSVVVGGMFAFNNLAMRIALAEQIIEQESKMYQSVQVEMNKRLERMEHKIDTLAEHIYESRNRR